jgi:hypothetical protein
MPFLVKNSSLDMISVNKLFGYWFLSVKKYTLKTGFEKTKNPGNKDESKIFSGEA